MAKENSARVLVPMLVQMGYKEENITVAFRKEYTVGDLTRILEKGTAL
jgi:p-aminobenzoyl-glutamate transporter AbgT